MPMRWNGEASGRILIINGGNIVIDADADGLDSNGAIEMNGGTVYVLGPIDNGNGALDYDETFSMNGGTLLAFGSQGMAMNVSDGSQPSILIGFSAQQAANSTFSLLDANGNTIAEFTPSKVYSSVVVSTPALKLNEKYTYTINGTQAGELTLSQAISSTGITGGFGGGF